MPGRSGVTAPIVPDSRTTGTTAVARRNRARNEFHQPVDQARPSIAMRRFGLSCRYLEINQFLSRGCH